MLRNEYPSGASRDGSTKVWLYDVTVDGAPGRREWWVRASP